MRSKWLWAALAVLLPVVALAANPLNTPDRATAYPQIQSYTMNTTGANSIITVYLVAKSDGTNLDNPQTAVNAYWNSGSLPANTEFRRIVRWKMWHGSANNIVVAITSYLGGITTGPTNMVVMPFVYNDMPIQADSIRVQFVSGGANTEVGHYVW